MSGFLDKTGLTQLWGKIKAYADKSIVSLSADGNKITYTKGNGTSNEIEIDTVKNLVDGSTIGSVRGIGAGITIGSYAFAEGSNSVANGYASHAEGHGTIATAEGSHVEGTYNIEDTAEQYVHITGNGSSSNGRSNAHTIDWNGNGWFKGALYVGGTSQTSGASKITPSALVATETTPSINDTINWLYE